MVLYDLKKRLYAADCVATVLVAGLPKRMGCLRISPNRIRSVLLITLLITTVSLSFAQVWPVAASNRLTIDAVDALRVNEFVLVDATTNRDLLLLRNGMTLDLATFTTRQFNIRAETNAAVSSVRFGLNGNADARIENVAPFALAGDSNGNYHAMSLQPGSYRVAAIPYSRPNAAGAAGNRQELSFTVVENTRVPTVAPTATPVVSPAPTPTALSTPPPTPTAGAPTGGSGRVSGTLVQWHPLTVTFTGPTADESDSEPNPFLDYRLTVTFTSPNGQSQVVPGFFGGDGQGNGRGNQWQVRFAPEAAGRWTYHASFRGGSNVAISQERWAGEAISFDGAVGEFWVADRDPGASGFLKWGRLEYIGEHYLKFRDGPYWVKGGTDSPENFFGYAEFDNTVDQGCSGAIHRYEPHIGDWRRGDPTWTGSDGIGNKGKGIIGALNYLGSAGVNSLYFLPMNLGGDGCDTYPFVAGENTNFNKIHYDVSKLHQWNIVMEHAQQQGIALHFVLNETEWENEQWLDYGQLGVERKLFYRELIARFGHLLAIKWNLSEESDFSPAHLRSFAGYISDLDWANHQITVHTHPNALWMYDALLGDSRFDTTAVQYSPDNAGAYTELMRSRSANAGRPWVVDMDENNPAGEGLTDTNADDLRKRVLYDVYFSGGNLEWYFGYHALPLGGDLRTENMRTREAMWNFMRYARTFMIDHLPFWQMSPADHLLAGEHWAYGGGEVFAAAGERYAVYLPNAGVTTATLDLRAAAGQPFSKRWFNPRTGQFAGNPEAVTGGLLTIGAPPHSAEEDWVLLLTRTGSSAPNPLPTAHPTITPSPAVTPNPTATPSPTATPGNAMLRVVRFVLVNADTDGDIRPLADGDTVALNNLPTHNLNIRADVEPAGVGSVRFALNENPNFRTESLAPFALVGDHWGNYMAWVPTAGEYTLTATPYERQHAAGAVGTARTIRFTVTGQITTVEAVAATGTAGVNGLLYHDRNRNGQPDGGEDALGNIPFVVMALDQPERQAPESVTYADGSVVINHLSPGRYRIIPQLPDHLFALNPAAGEVTLATGEQAELGDFVIVNRADIDLIYLPLLER